MDKFKILLVDDDHEMHQAIPVLFQDDRLEFQNSYSFKDSVVKLASSNYDLLICDYDLGVKSGIDLANISKKYRPNTDIFLLVVNYEYSSVQPLASEAKVMQCFEKPFIPANLIQGILTLLNKKSDLLNENKVVPKVTEIQPAQEAKSTKVEEVPENELSEVEVAVPLIKPVLENNSQDINSEKKSLSFSGMNPSLVKQGIIEDSDDNSGSTNKEVAPASQDSLNLGGHSAGPVLTEEVKTVASSKEVVNSANVGDLQETQTTLNSLPAEDNVVSENQTNTIENSTILEEKSLDVVTTPIGLPQVNQQNTSDLLEESESIVPDKELVEDLEEETFDMEEFSALLSKPKKDINSLEVDGIDIPEPVKSIDSDLTAIDPQPDQKTAPAPESERVDGQNISDEEEPEVEKTFVRPSAFKTLDGGEVELKEVTGATSLNLKAIQEDHKEKVALEESNALLAELVNEVDDLRGAGTEDLENLGKVKKVKVASIQDEVNEAEVVKAQQEKMKEEASKREEQAENEISQQSESATEDSGFGFSSKPKNANVEFDVGFENLSEDVNLDPVEPSVESNPFECKFPEERGRKDPYLRVVIAQNILSAALVCYPLEDDHHTMESVKKELELKNVTYNIDYELIEKLIQKVNLMREPILGEIIATGHSAVHGKNGYIDLSFSNSLDVSLNEEVDGKVDFKNIYKIDCVREGEFLGEVIAPTLAVPGKGVTGFVLKGKNGKPKPILPGKGARFDKTTQKFYSAIEGQPFLRGNKIIVSPLYVVPNGVDYSTGNISFVGSVHVCGDVGSGFTVEAEGDILVEGIVEGAILKAGGSVKVQRGFAGAEKGEIYAEGDVRCKYISNGTVEAEGNILVEDSIINSTVTSHAKVKVFNKKGNILGGLVRAQDSVRVLNLGSEFGVGTKIIVGSHFILREQLGEINKAQKFNSLKMDKISKGIQSFTNLATGKSLDKSHMAKLKQLKAILKKLKLDEDNFEAKKDELLKEFNKKCMSKIYVRNHAHPGVSVQIGNTVYALNDVFTNCSFFEDRFKAVVKLGTYEEE